MVERNANFIDATTGSTGFVKPEFRLGESSGKPLGGNIAETPFAQALYAIAKSRGYESQMDLARIFGHKGNGIIRQWYSAITFPDAEHFGALLRLLKPDNEELDALVEPWREHLRDMAISHSRIGRARLKETDHRPLRRYFGELAESHDLTLLEIARSLRVSYTSFSIDVSTSFLSEILERAPGALNLNEKETAKLAEAVAVEVATTLVRGKKSKKTFSGSRLWNLRKGLRCKTYTPAEAAEELTVSRQYVGQLRIKYGLPLLMTEDHLRILRERPDLPNNLTPKKKEMLIRDDKVKKLRNQGFYNGEIATELDLSISQVATSIGRLLNRGEIRRKGEKKGEFLRRRVESLRKEGRDNAEILSILEISYRVLSYHVGKLIREGRTGEQKRGRKKTRGTV